MNDKNGFYLYYIMFIGCDVNICNKIYIGGIQMKSLNGGTINVNQNSDNCRKKNIAENCVYCFKQFEWF